ncbi:hypothetical protein R1sor_002755 [Riccia sorocarpa]|uniref:LAGLIDADG homing endonuclease n=1 Tax=Riccia sorocarpa TaxID=122646 RepID=A0ABD3H027_9MARC
MSHSTAIVDNKPNGDGDIVLLCNNSLRIVERGVSGKGYAAWIRREEKYKWELCVIGADLVDARLCATKTPGPHFTRQAWHGSRFDQSRLDRLYLTGGGKWVYHIRVVENQGARTLSDHVRVSLEVITKATEARTRIRRSYFKMEFKTLMRP